VLEILKKKNARTGKESLIETKKPGMYDLAHQRKLTVSIFLRFFDADVFYISYCISEAVRTVENFRFLPNLVVILQLKHLSEIATPGSSRTVI
jgi:hypothetical protein